MIAGIVVGLVAFVGAIFAVRQWIMRLENQQPTVETDSGFAMWSQDVPGERHAQKNGVQRNREPVAYSNNTSTWDDDRDEDAARQTGIGMASVASDWERDDPRNAPDAIPTDPGFSDESDMGSLDSDSSTETDSSSSDTDDSSDSSSSDSDFSDSSDMGGLDN